MNKITLLIEELKKVEDKLIQETQKSKKEYFYVLIKNRVKFESSIRLKHKKLAQGILGYLLDINPVYFLTAPVIYSLIIPALILDAFVSFYQFSCFPVYKIPKVKRKDYIIIDHHFLSYLNIIEKMNCVYCSYFNGLMAYVQEIAARSEQHFCPLKHARKLVTMHSRYNKFLDYGAAEDYKHNAEKTKNDFKDIKN